MRTLVAFIAALSLTSTASASFHLIQVEQIIAAVEGDTTAQAIQLRMRAAGQDRVSSSRVRAWDAAGANPVLVLDISSDVTNAQAGSRVLLATQAFVTAVQASNPQFAADFIMANPIPPSYLAAGRLTFESDSGNILWSLAWGGANYTGSNAGATTNDPDGDFGPAFAGALPTADRRGVIFNDPAETPSTTNAEDYALSPIPAAVTNNSGSSFFIGSKQEISIEQPLGTQLVDGSSKKSFGTAVIGQNGRTRKFTIRNVGTARLSGLAINKTGANPGNFSVSELAKTSLAPGGSTTFTVTFTPSAAGQRTATIRISSNDANENPFDIKLAGFGAE